MVKRGKDGRERSEGRDTGTVEWEEAEKSAYPCVLPERTGAYGKEKEQECLNNDSPADKVKLPHAGLDIRGLPR